MKTALLDTNVLIALFKGDDTLAEVISTFDKVLIPTVVLGEFKAGIAMDIKNGQLQRATLDEFLDAPAVEVVPISEQTSDSYALVFKALKERGTPIPQNDIWIAAIAIEYGAVLLSRDSHFSAVPILKTQPVMPPR